MEKQPSINTPYFAEIIHNYELYCIFQAIFAAVLYIESMEAKMRNHNRQYKDSVFVDFFSEDRTAKANFLALYNALHGTDYQSTAILKNIRLKQVLYMTH